jgi:hypothetical protein
LFLKMIAPPDSKAHHLTGRGFNSCHPTNEVSLSVTIFSTLNVVIWHVSEEKSCAFLSIKIVCAVS